MISDDQPIQLPIQSDYANRHNLMWSRSEKAVARKAFDTALKRELHQVIQEAKQMASRIQQPLDLRDFRELGRVSGQGGMALSREFLTVSGTATGCQRNRYADCPKDVGFRIFVVLGPHHVLGWYGRVDPSPPKSGNVQRQPATIR